MCGIAGWYRRGGRPVPQDAVERQCDRLRHRGPDDAGYLIDGDFGFGMRRLSIIDLEGGHQPILSPDGRYAIIFNGEIVNHPSLRRELESGYAFKTDHSDTETILAAYLRWGDDAWLRLEGMYAVAIWDKHDQEPDARPRPRRHQAIVLHRAVGRPRLRVGNHGAARASRACRST